MSTDHSFILKLSCADRPGIVHAVSGFLFERGSNILDSAQFGDSHTGEFFMRVHFQQVGGDPGLDALRSQFGALAAQFGMQWELHDATVKPRVVIMVSKIGHCLNDLLFRYRTGQLSIEIPAIISNHKDFYQLAASYDIPFHHFPLTSSKADAKAAQEARVLEVIDEHQADLVVLARYMQILSPQLCDRLAGRAINIHHSF
ncbi:MAG TPA: formyltetrahydrofolate deformylase, partial [Paraburkholderia sp.]|nr:formyltetrahydrofolate deformylase [Paraburkholderia sp.]